MFLKKNISKTIWILVMSKLRVPAPFQMRERNATDPFHVTRVVALLQVIVIAIGVVQAAVLHDGQQGASLYP